MSIKHLLTQALLQLHMRLMIYHERKANSLRGRCTQETTVVIIGRHRECMYLSVNAELNLNDLFEAIRFARMISNRRERVRREVQL